MKNNIGLKNNVLKLKAPAKINLHLEILGDRNDGFHELSMMMQSIDLYDILSFEEFSENNIVFNSDSKMITNTDDNLIIKAAKLLKKYCNVLDKGIKIDLKKCIPIGAGLAGGSADAAATLIGCNKVWELGLSIKELEILSAQLGSDIPFCLKGGRQLCFGRGEILEQLETYNKNLAIILVKDRNLSISTPWAYKEYKKKYRLNYLTNEVEFEYRRFNLRNFDFNKIINKDGYSIRNDLQCIVTKEYKQIETTIKFLRNLPNSIDSSMSGSGPSCFALFEDINYAKETYNNNLKEFDDLNLDAWCCSLLNNGVKSF